MRIRRSSLIALLVAPVTLVTLQVEAGAETDCGTRCLALLLELESRSLDYASLEAMLPSPTSAGQSAANLRAASRRAGLELLGRRLAGAELPRGVPVIAFLNHEGHGHFVLIRPVGSTGRLVQICDPPRPPTIREAREVVSWRSWTGIVLVPDRHHRVRAAVCILMALLGVALIGVGLRALRGSNRLGAGGGDK